MTLVAAVEAVVIAAAIYLFLRHQREQDQAWARERRELVNRITHPEIVPVQTAPEFTAQDEPDDEIDLVGVVQEPTEEDYAALFGEDE